jgi:hypothetical protein
MHVLLKAAPEVVLEVTPGNGRRYSVTFRNGSAFVPLHLGEYLIRQKLAIRGEENDPPPQFERLPGGAHGRALDRYADHVSEVTP